MATEYVDHGISGTKERRPALDAMIAAARARKIDVVVATKLDRLARSTHQLISLGKELEALGVDLVVLDQAIDTTSSCSGLVSPGRRPRIRRPSQRRPAPSGSPEPLAQIPLADRLVSTRHGARRRGDPGWRKRVPLGQGQQ